MSKKSSATVHNIKPFIRSAEFVRSTVNEKDRTVEVVWSTGEKVMRGGWFEEPYWEELSMDPAHVRLERLNGGAPFLDNHSRWDLDDVIGVVVKAWIENGEGRAIVRFDEGDEEEPGKLPRSEKIFRKVKRGTLRNISIGYRVLKLQKVSSEEEKVATKRAIEWEPFEISLVPVGADSKAGTRSSDDQELNPCELIARDMGEGEGDNMKTKVQQESEKTRAAASETTTEQPEATTETAAPAADPAPAVAAAAAPAATDEKAEEERALANRNDERARILEIQAACRAANLPEEFSKKLIEENTSLEKARGLIMDESARSQSVTIKNQTTVEHGNQNERDTRVRSITSALLIRGFGEEKYKPEMNANEYRGMSLLELAKECLEASGTKTRGLGKMEVASRAFHSTSDFPLILEGVVNKSLRDAYAQAAQTFRPLVRVVELPDFKQVYRNQLGDAPALKEVVENAEITRGTMSEAQEKYKLKTFARIVGLSRQLIINDDLNALTRIPSGFGLQASNLESDLVWGIILANAAMGDNVALFHADHKNLGTAGAIGETTVSEARKLMKKQKGLGKDASYLNLTPKFVIVAPERETEAEKFFAPIVPNLASSVNPFSGKCQIISEARLSPTTGLGAYYFAAGVEQVDTIELAYLQGQRGLFTETRMGFDVDGMEIKARLDVGAAPIDFRGLVKNAGN
jgi:hypothetical protein